MDKVVKLAKYYGHNALMARTDIEKAFRIVSIRPSSLIGLLNFACSVVCPPGRAFLRRLIDLIIGISKAHHSIWLTSLAHADIKI